MINFSCSGDWLHVLHDFLEICAGFCMYQYFIPFLWPNNFPWYGNITVNVLRLPYHFTEWYNQYYLKFLSIIYEWSSLSTSSPTFGIITHIYFSRSDRYIKITYCGDNMHFSGGWWCWNILMCLFAICIWTIWLCLLPISNCSFTLMCVLRVFCMIYTCGLHYFPSQSIYWLFNLLKGLSQSKSFKIFDSVQFSSVAQSCLTLLQPYESQHTRLPYPSPTPGVYSNSCPSSW